MKKLNGNDYSTVVILPDGTVAQQVYVVKDKISEPFTFNAEQTATVLLDPIPTKRLVIQAVLITGAGSQGVAKVYRESRPLGKAVLPCYFTASNRVNTSSELNLVMNLGEKLLLTTTGRGTNETFIGVGYNLEEE